MAVTGQVKALLSPDRWKASSTATDHHCSHSAFTASWCLPSVCLLTQCLWLLLPQTLGHPFLCFAQPSGAHSLCQLSDSVYFGFASVTVLPPDPGLGLSAPVPTYVCLKSSTMMTRAKNCSSISCCCDHMFEWKHWCLILKIWDNSQANSRFSGFGGEPAETGDAG